MAETLDRTSLGELVPGSRVNLERAVTPLDRLGGHLVQGHVDGVGSDRRRASTPSTGTSSRSPYRRPARATSRSRGRSRWTASRSPSPASDGVDRHVLGQPHPDHPRADHPRFQSTRRPRQPRGRRGREVRRATARPPSPRTADMDPLSVFRLLDGYWTIGGHRAAPAEVVGNVFGLASAILGMRTADLGLAGRDHRQRHPVHRLRLRHLRQAAGARSLGQAGRQVFFIAVSVYGWWRWRAAASGWAARRTAARSRRGGPRRRSEPR